MRKLIETERHKEKCKYCEKEYYVERTYYLAEMEKGRWSYYYCPYCQNKIKDVYVRGTEDIDAVAIDD